MEVVIGDATPRFRWAVYTGTNGAGIVEGIPGHGLVSDTGEVLLIGAPNGDQVDASVGQVLLWRQKGNSASGLIAYDQAGFTDLFNITGG
jgi:hypothetical protein